MSLAYPSLLNFVHSPPQKTVYDCKLHPPFLLCVSRPVFFLVWFSHCYVSVSLSYLQLLYRSRDPLSMPFYALCASFSLISVSNCISCCVASWLDLFSLLGIRLPLHFVRHLPFFPVGGFFPSLFTLSVQLRSLPFLRLLLLFQVILPAS